MFARSNNPLLENYLETPNCIKEVFRISRILFKQQQHLILIGQPGCGKSEYLQLAAILNDALLFELNTSRFGDTTSFIGTFKRILLSIVQLNRPTFLVISDLYQRDPLYLDWIYHFLVHYCNRTETFSLWHDPAFAASFIEHERGLYHASAIKKPQEASNEQYLMQAMRKLQKNMHLVLVVEDMQSYFEWVGLFPSLEYMFEVAYIDEMSNEGYKQMTQSYLSNKESDNSIFAEAKLTSAIVELKQLVKNQVLQCFYSPQMLKHTSSDDYMITSITEFVMASDTKLNGYLFSDGLFGISDMHQRSYHYSLSVPTTSLNLSRFVSFLELFRYLFDYLSLSLLVRRNYYEAFLRKASEFQQFFKDIKVRKSDLGGEGLQIGMQVATLKDKIAKMRAGIEEREDVVQKRLAEMREVEAELKEAQTEIEIAVAERDGALDAVIQQIEKAPGSEYLFVMSQYSKINEKEAKILEMFSVLVEKSSLVETYDRQEHSHFFSDREDLIAMLNERRNQYFDDLCLTRFKDFITEVNPMDFRDRPLLKYFYHYFFELFKKINLRHSKGQVYSRIAQFKEQIQNMQFSLNYSQNYIRDRTADLNQLLAQYKEAAGYQSRLSSQVEEAEISHMRTEHIIDQIERYCNKIIGKLHKTKKRQESVLGDALVMAASVVFLGWFSMKERKLIRSEMADYLQKTTAGAIKCSPKWTEKGGHLNSKLFRQIVKEYGINRSQQSQIIHSQSQGILSQETLSESLFTLLFAPSCPYVSDPTGALQTLLQQNLAQQNSQLKRLYASDSSINTKLDQILRSQSGSTFATLNDLNDLSSQRYGLCQDQSLLNRLCRHLYNGFEHDEKMLRDPAIQGILKHVYTTHASVNKRLQVSSGGAQDQNDRGGSSLSLYQVQIFTPRLECMLNSDYKSRATMLIAIDDDEHPNGGPYTVLSQNSAWIDIKEVMLKHFLPEECQKLKEIRAKTVQMDHRKAIINKNFESAFLLANSETLKNLGEYSILKQSVEDIKLFNIEKKALLETYQATLTEHPLLSSYANVISAMFLSLKKLSQITGELTCTWDLFLSIIDQILEKILRDLTNKLQAQAAQQSNHKSSTSIIIDSQGRLAVRSTKHLLGKVPSGDTEDYVDFTLDEEFFSTQVIPQIHSVMTSSIKVHLLHLYNLILAVKLAYKKKEITEGEIEFFFKQLFHFKGFEGWRNIQYDLINMDDKVEKTRFLAYKRELIKIYPDHGRRITELIEKEIGQAFSYREASRILNFRIFQDGSEFKKHLKMFELINVGFLCPDHEFKTRLTQLVYEQLSSVFNFSEIQMKFHDFVKLAAWNHPIALIPHRSLNILNTLTSMATYFGVSDLCIIRSSDLSLHPLTSTTPEEEHLSLVESNLQDYSLAADLSGYTKDASVYTRLQDVSSLSEDVKQQVIFGSACMPKVNVEGSIRGKDRLVMEHEARIVEGSQNPLKVIEKAAKNGKWVMIASLRFPRYWLKVVELLDKLRKDHAINHTFRLFFDLQGYPQNEIPDSFLSAHAVSFHLSPKNVDSLDAPFQDIWTTCLDPKVLDKLTEYAPVFPETLQSQAIQKGLISDHLQKNALKSLSDLEQLIANESYDGAMTLTEQQNKYIGEDQQRELYNQFIEQSQSIAESTAKQFTDQMKLNDDYMEAVEKQIAEEGGNYRRNEARQAVRSNGGPRFIDPSREITPYTKINMGQKSGQNQSKAGPISTLSMDKVIEEVKKEEQEQPAEHKLDIHASQEDLEEKGSKSSLKEGGSLEMKVEDEKKEHEANV